VNSAISTFEQDGKQYLVTYAGGGLFGGKKGDSVWLFALDGTLDPVVPEQQAGGPVNMPAPGRQADLANGEAIYKAACVYCHGEKGTGGEGGGKAIQRSLRTEGIFAVLSTGRNTMPAFSSSMNAEQLHDVASYLMQVLLIEE
jgi:cytochrome c5